MVENNNRHQSRGSNSKNYKGYRYEVSYCNRKRPSTCPYCAKTIKRKAMSTINGINIISCHKCIDKAIDNYLRYGIVRREPYIDMENRINYEREIKTKVKNAELLSHIDFLMNETKKNRITWKEKFERDGDLEITIYAAVDRNLCLQKSDLNGSVQYMLIEDKTRTSNSSLKNLEKEILNHKSGKKSYSSAGGKNQDSNKNDAKKSTDSSSQKKTKQFNPKESKKREIEIKEFLVRRSVFKCMHDNHNLRSIAAVVRVLDSKGNEKKVEIPAGYCNDCNVYFILESSYEKLRRYGVPLCRISDEKNYMKSISANGMRLAQESLLKQYGYNVSQSEGLKSITRKKILAVLIDYKILTKSEIISYLDFFISQRKTQSKYKYAISKWEEDREFVEEYKIGTYQKVSVNAISRK